MGHQPAPKWGHRIVIDRKALLKDLQGRVKALEKDLKEQVGAVPDVGARLKLEYDRAFKLGRTAATWTPWRDERVTQAAVAWVLGTVFVRFCEDNRLLAEPMLAGPDTERLALAEEAQEEYFREHRLDTDRDWLLAAFGTVGESQAGRLLFDPKHNAAYQIPVSHDAAKDLIAFWRRRDEDGTLIHDFTDPAWNTRFLGDLYQDLSDHAKSTYALLQTPDFVEEFILDLTLTPAIEEFGYDVVKMIDPTCGSGHFLLDAFQRLLAEWEAAGKEPWDRVRLALDAIHGVDINPFAVAIARFRLLLAGMRAAGFATLAEVAKYEFPIHVAIGDSLIKHRQLDLLAGSDELVDFKYTTEDLDEYAGILSESRYHVVVGNPPYIAVKDRSLSKLYRDIYSACIGGYTLSVPFAQRFFGLAKNMESDRRGAGYVGQITANSFMKREFGVPLILQYFATEVDFSFVIDASGAFVPGHGTPTVILVGQPRRRGHAQAVRTVRSVRGEPGEPEEPRTGRVWQAIVDGIDWPGKQGNWVSVEDLDRKRYFNRFPWILEDGGLELVEHIEAASSLALSRLATRIGFFGDTHADDAFTLASHRSARKRAADLQARVANKGDQIRDWCAPERDLLILPYSEGKGLLMEAALGTSLIRYLWPLRTELWHRSTFGGGTYASAGRQWWEWHQLPVDRGAHSWAIRFAFVATHAHFVLDREHRASTRTAPVIKLPGQATEGDHLQLLGVLNSSLACFWLKQVSHHKGNGGIGGGIGDEDWEPRYEFTGTKLQEFPLPVHYPLDSARELDRLAQRLAAMGVASVAAAAVPTRKRLDEARAGYESTRARMIALQEELDWQVYSLYNLLDDELTLPAESVPELKLGERAFEIVLARRVAAGEEETQWFARHGSSPITDLPGHWSAEYRTVVERRIAVIGSNRNIGLIERPKCKRRWASEGWEAMQARALRDWLLDRCEARELWYATDENGVTQPRPLTTGRLADELRRDPDFVSVAELYAPGQELGKVVADLVADEHVPFLAALRYKQSGLDKRQDWEAVWDLQRAEDAAPDEPAKRKIRERTPVPPKYQQADFVKTSYWRQRGKLDVPKERFVSYPGASRDGDPSLLIGWAGWDHREQAQALATLIVSRLEDDGWSPAQVTPLVAGLREVMPWVRQWHGEFDPDLGDSPANIYDGFLADTTNRLHLTDAVLTGWRPEATTRRGRRGDRRDTV